VQLVGPSLACPHQDFVARVNTQEDEMDQARAVIGDVDTHAATHCAAVIDTNGALLATAQFGATPAGYRELLAWLGWLGSHGELVKVGVEGTGSYGAGLARVLTGAGAVVVEVPRPDRRMRVLRGKSDPIDAETAARAALGGSATAAAKGGDGAIEAIRQLRLARSGAVKAKTAALNSLRALLITAPEQLRVELEGLSRQRLLTRCAGLRPQL
jgi:transposase